MTNLKLDDVDMFKHAGLNHSLSKIMKMNEQAIEKADIALEKAKKLPLMMRYNISALKSKYELH